VNEAFVFFPETSKRLRLEEITITGMPVRSQFQPLAPASCRMALGLDSRRPVVLVMGGSQGAQGINDLMIETLPLLAEAPDYQYLHLTGVNDVERVRAAYRELKLKAIVRPFLTEMELALGAASMAISRSGASSLAELAAMRLPAVLVPYPAAVDNHQYYNALAFVNSGAARMLEQKTATPQALKNLIVELAGHDTTRNEMAVALAKWHYPNSAALVAKRMFAVMGTPLAAGSETESGSFMSRGSGPAGDRLKRGAVAL
jgi:UDP-N-acetylglucosamine--N-acetylmuramyl-(pentapeptide) pyrophosphoryl-undecaprenol N-acetylglucosamine transferase